MISKQAIEYAIDTLNSRLEFLEPCPLHEDSEEATADDCTCAEQAYILTVVEFLERQIAGGTKVFKINIGEDLP